MDENTHDDEPTRWTSIGWQAALITNRLRCTARLSELASEEQAKEGVENPKSGDKEEAGPEANREYVEACLREITAWEAKLMTNRI